MSLYCNSMCKFPQFLSAWLAFANLVIFSFTANADLHQLIQLQKLRTETNLSKLQSLRFVEVLVQVPITLL